MLPEYIETLTAPAVGPGKWPGPMPLTRTLPPLDPTERPMRLLADACGLVGMHPTIRATAGREAIVITLGVEDAIQLARSIVPFDTDPFTCEDIS